MTTQPKSKILITIIGILLITNIALLSFYFLNRPAPNKVRADRAAMISAFLQNDLGFNQQQLKQYDSLNTQHRILIKAKFDEMRLNKENEFKQLTKDNFSDSSINNSAASFAGKQKEVEITMFKYFKDIRNLCTPQQLPKFDSSFYKIMNRRNDERKK